MSGGCPHLVWALFQKGLSASERVVLVYLANKANGSRVCWPAVPTIAKEMELSVRTVQGAIQRLSTLGLIRIEARRRETHNFHILRPADPKPPPAPPAQRPMFAWNLPDPEPATPQELHPGPPPPAEPTPQILRPASDPAEIAVPANSAPCHDPAEIADPPRKKPLSDPADSADESTKKESTKESTKGPRARAQPGSIPVDWSPGTKSIALAASLGLDPGRVTLEADQMRDWAISSGKTGRDWDRRFDVWLREEAKRDRRGGGGRYDPHRLSPSDTMRREWKLPTFLTPILDDEPDPAPSLLIEAMP
jgi:GntR family transcriptional regulator